MKTYEYYRNLGRSEEWIEENLSGLCGDCEMIRFAKFDDHSDIYLVGGYILYINHSTYDVIEQCDEDGEVIESWLLK